MPIHRVHADRLVSVATHCREALAQLEPLLEAGDAGLPAVPAAVPAAAGAVEAALEEVSDLVEGSSLAFELPIWADPVRLRMIQQTLADCAAESGAIVAGDVALAQELVLLALDTVESTT